MRLALCALLLALVGCKEDGVRVAWRSSNSASHDYGTEELVRAAPPVAPVGVTPAGRSGAELFLRDSDGAELPADGVPVTRNAPPAVPPPAAEPPAAVPAPEPVGPPGD